MCLWLPGHLASSSDELLQGHLQEEERGRPGACCREADVLTGQAPALRAQYVAATAGVVPTVRCAPSSLTALPAWLTVLRSYS